MQRHEWSADFNRPVSVRDPADCRLPPSEIVSTKQRLGSACLMVTSKVAGNRSETWTDEAESTIGDIASNVLLTRLGSVCKV